MVAPESSAAASLAAAGPVPESVASTTTAATSPPAQSAPSAAGAAQPGHVVRTGGSVRGVRRRTFTPAAGRR